MEAATLPQALTAALARRGYSVVPTANQSPVVGEIARAALPRGDGALVVVASRPYRPEEVAFIAEVVRALAETSAGGAPAAAPSSLDKAHADPPATPAPPQPMPSAASATRRLIGRSAAMQELHAMIDRLAPNDSASVLIQGENGTGKELVAQAIHASSPRHHRRFVVTNCSAFNDNLLDSELFGHKRGAFTGAVSDTPGLFEAADLGTFFFDEIGDMSAVLQAKVLRVLQDGSFLRVGDSELRRVDVRVIAATNRDLAAMVARGEFREDLYYRINVINIMVPALRHRREDIPLLVSAFLERYDASGRKQLSPACAQRMLDYGWPGNVRELENEVERLVVLAGDSTTIDLDLLTPRIRDGVRAPRANPESLPEAVESLEREMIAAALVKYRGNKSRAAQALEISRRNLIRLVQKYRL